jgi:hypothetical protein
MLDKVVMSESTAQDIRTLRMRWTGHVVGMREMGNAYRILVGKPEGKRSLGRCRGRWENNIRMDLREIGAGRCGLDASGSGQRPVAGFCEHGNEPSGFIKGGGLLTSWVTVIFPRMTLLHGVS